ncbi:MAG: acyl-CoA/acyl-ACP dehydrogenase [Deltaproteobacteria bacterium]|nr:acyl-CoA/acyl-ACP dehydrogenase [Deltaproteobacteria bacterium]
MDFRLNKEQKDIRRAAREFALGEFPDRAQEFDREETFDLDIWRKACDLGFIGVFIDEEYGGAGYGYFEHSLISEEFWTVDPGIGQSLTSASFGSEILLLYGTEEQKQLVLPQIVEGKAMIATTNGNLAKYVVLFALTNPEQPSRHDRHSFILVPTDSAGYESNKLRGKLGIRASDTAELSFSDLRVPLANLIGEEGEGFKELMAFFNRTRLHVCAQGVGVARAALEEGVKYAKERHQFGVPLASFQTIQFKLAEMATRVRAARNLYYEAAWLVDQGTIDHSLISMAKWYAKCADEALQIHGGYGYLDEYKVQRLYRDAKIVEIYEGAKEIEKAIIAKSLLGQ